MWDIQGLEALVSVDEARADYEQYEKDKVWARLKGETLPAWRDPTGLRTMILRARFNSQRHYEIYQFSTVDLDEEAIRDAFENTPQFMVDFIRRSGLKIFSDRIEYQKAVIV